MILVRALLLVFLVFASGVVPAQAEGLLRTVPARLDPAKAYVLVEIRNHDGLRTPGSIVLARYDPVGGDVRGGARSPGLALGRRVPVRFGVATRPLLRSPESRLYLLELEPDTWVIEGAAGTAFSLGSRSFVLAAGQVVDLGVISPRTDWPEGEGPQRLTVGRLAGIALLGPFARSPQPRPAMLEIRSRGAADLTVPEALRAAIAPVEFSDGARFGNYLGGLVNRLDGRRGRPDPPLDSAPTSVD